MDKFLSKPREEITATLEETAARLNLMPHIVEKDFWVCWILKLLYSIPECASIIFKGGTSLSKAYGLIERFSEDVDLTIDKSTLEGIKDPSESGISGKELTRRIDALIETIEHYISDKLLPLLNSTVRKALTSELNWKLEIDDKQTILFYYPQLLSDLSAESYIKPVIRLELGARGGILPKENKIIRPYIAEAFPRSFIQSDCSIPTLLAERTFWEKITILHSLYYRHQKGKRIGHRMSRHYYDIYMMDKKGITVSALDQKDLLKEVIKNNMVFFKDASSSYSTAKLGELRLKPSNEMLSELQQDYKEMEIMIIKNCPDFESIMFIIDKLETKLNNID